MPTKGQKLATAATAAFNRGAFADAITGFVAAGDRLIKDGEISEVCAVFRQLADAQTASKQYQEAYASTDKALAYATPDIAPWIAIDRANIIEEAGSPEAAQAWRYAAAQFPPSSTTLSCLAHAAGADIRHGRPEGFAAARELAATSTTEMQHVTIAGDAGRSAREQGRPLLAQAVRLMVWHGKAFAGHILHKFMFDMHPTNPDLVASLCLIASYDGLQEVRKLLPLKVQGVVFMMPQELERRVPGLARLAEERGGTPSTLPLHDWFIKPDEKQANQTRLDQQLREMVPDGWWVVRDR